MGMYFHNTKSSIKSAIEYNMSDVDHSKKERKHKPIFMHGDTEKILRMEKLAKDSGIENTHSSLTIAFRDKEFSELKNPDGSYNEDELKAKMQPIIDGFRSTWFPGMKEGENFLDHWSIHTDKGNIELNCAFLKMELTTGRAFNPFPPGQLNLDMRDAYVDLMNEELGFDRIVRSPFSVKHNECEIKDIQNPSEIMKYQKEFVKPKKDEIQLYLSDLIVKGKINSRDDLIKTLQKDGEVKFLDKENDKSKYNYISFVPEGFDKAIRLEGPMFQKDANFDLLREQHLENKNNFRLSEKEISEKSNKLKTHMDIQKDRNKSILQSKVKSRTKNSGRKYMSKAKRLDRKMRMDLKKQDNKNKSESAKQQYEAKKNEAKQKDNDPNEKKKDVNEEINQNAKKLQNEIEQQGERRKVESEKSMMKEEQKQEKTESETEKLNSSIEKTQDQADKQREISESKQQEQSYKMPSHSGNGSSSGILSQITGLNKQCGAIDLQISSLQSQISSLNIFKFSDIKKIDEIKRKIVELEQRKAELALKIEQLGDALAQAKKEEMNKGNNFTPKGFKPKF